MNGTDKNVVLLELGVGEMTPSIIKLPFWEMTYKNEKVFYACLNQKKSSVPEPDTQTFDGYHQSDSEDSG